MRIIGGFILIAFLLVRIFYKAFVTKDIMKNPDELYFGIGLIAAWVLIYNFIFMLN